MEMFKVLIVILLSSVFVDNYVLNRFLGICPFLGVSKKIDQAVGMGVAVTVVMLLQYQNASLPMLVTLSGMVMLSRLLQS